MVKSYLRYEPASAFGVVVSVDGNISYDSSGRHLLAPALEKVGVWNVPQGICTKTLSPSPSSRGPSLAVTSIAPSPSSLIASGYADGSIRIWDCEKGTCEVTFNGHKGAVTALRYNKSGSPLASGSKDNDIIIWDVVGETGLFRLRGHRDQFTDVLFLDSGKKLVSSSKDKFLRVSDLETQHCMQIIGGHHSEIWSVDIDPEERYLVTGSADVELRFYTVKHELGVNEHVSSLEENGTLTDGQVDVVEAHGGAIQSIAMIPEENGFVTGSADHEVKFWEFRNLQNPAHDPEHLLQNVGSKIMDDDVSVVAVRPDAKYVVVALLDCTVTELSLTTRGTKSSLDFGVIRSEWALVAMGELLTLFSWKQVLFMDSHKIFLTLYGHKLPVLCMDISLDGALIVTGSADKNLKIWGFDFGDCHKSIFAHADSVMAVQFVGNSHYLFSVGKDRLLATVAISLLLDLLTVLYDTGIVLMNLFLLREEEKEKRLEEMFESDLDNSLKSRYAPKEEIPEEAAVAIAGKRTQETLTATDSIIEALDLADIALKRIAECEEEKAKGLIADFRPNILMLGLSPSDYVLRAVSNVCTNDLEQTLLSLPFSDALKLMSYLRDWAMIPDKVELVSRIATVLLQTHYNQLDTTSAARPLLTSLKDILYSQIKGCKDMLGFNLAAMDHLKQLMSLRTDTLFRDAKNKLQEIWSRQSKRLEAQADPKDKRRKKKQKKGSDMHT
ncbi:Small-subunit processome, Utp12 [Dillenia turbinata]|uniref:Small-subunit processome, Utp12 n=1 Tax=Dillenia turbinata TaxID=194707 RepID=A0AAN8ZIQ3_9MAGN